MKEYSGQFEDPTGSGGSSGGDDPVEFASEQAAFEEGEEKENSGEDEEEEEEREGVGKEEQPLGKKVCPYFENPCSLSFLQPGLVVQLPLFLPQSYFSSGSFHPQPPSLTPESIWPR